MSGILLGMLQMDPTTLSVLDKQLERISTVLDTYNNELEQFVKDIPNCAWGDGHSLTISSTIRLAIYKTIKNVTYRDLSSSTRTDMALRCFCGITDRFWINKSSLQEAIATLPLVLIEKLNQIISMRFEDLSQVRIDSTAVAANVAQPENNNLLYESLRRGARLMSRIEELVGGRVFSVSIDAAAAKRISYDIRFEKNDTKEKTSKYKLILFMAGQVQDDMPMLIEQGKAALLSIKGGKKKLQIKQLVDQMSFLAEKLSCVIYQTIAWLQGEKLSPSDKLFSVATNMEHVDIIIKDNRKIVYGHKIDVVQGPRGIVTQIIIYHGNPNDSSNLLSTVSVLETIFKTTIKTLVTDGGYNSRENWSGLRQMKIKEIVFTRKRSLTLDDMGVSEERFSELKNWRTGIERGIGRLKKRFGFRKVICTSFERFELYLWMGVLASNLALIANKPTLFAEM